MPGSSNQLVQIDDSCFRNSFVVTLQKRSRGEKFQNLKKDEKALTKHLARVEKGGVTLEDISM